MESISGIFDKELTVSQLSALDSVGLKHVKSFVCRRGMRPYSRFFYIRNGKVTFTTGYGQATKKVEAVKGDIVYLPNDVEYESVWENENEIDYIIIIFCLSESDGKIALLTDHLCIIAHDVHGIYLKIFEDIAAIYKSSEVGYKFKCLSVFWRILYDILSEWTKNKLKAKDNIYHGVLYIENNFLREIDVNMIAKKCGLCPSTFRKKFKEAVGMTPFEYKNYLKTKKAVELLSTGEYNVTEVADILGFSDAFYFCKLFKQIWGMSPKQYVSNIQK